jgi:prevent-host-death family protein
MISASQLNAHALATIAEVAATRESVVVTKRGKPLVRIAPFEGPPTDHAPGKLAHTLVFEKDIVFPLGDEDWDACRCGTSWTPTCPASGSGRERLLCCPRHGVWPPVMVKPLFFCNRPRPRPSSSFSTLLPAHQENRGRRTRTRDEDDARTGWLP